MLGILKTILFATIHTSADIATDASIIICRYNTGVRKAILKTWGAWNRYTGSIDNRNWTTVRSQNKHWVEAASLTVSNLNRHEFNNISNSELLFCGVSVISSMLLRGSVSLRHPRVPCSLWRTASSSDTAELTHFPLFNSNRTHCEVEGGSVDADPGYQSAIVREWNMTSPTLTTPEIWSCLCGLFNDSAPLNVYQVATLDSSRQDLTEAVCLLVNCLRIQLKQLDCKLD